MCHTAKWDVSLIEGEAYETLLGEGSAQQDALALVEPGEPELSYLWHKLAGTHLEVGGEGERMPKGGEPLTVAQIDLVRAWIELGAEP